MNKAYKKISNYMEYENFDATVQGLHDSLLQEATLLSRGYVDRNGLMYGDSDPYDLKLVFHSQSSGAPYVEIIFKEVDIFRFECGYCIEPSIEFLDNCIQFYLTDQRDVTNNMICAKSMHYWIGTIID